MQTLKTKDLKHSEIYLDFGLVENKYTVQKWYGFGKTKTIYCGMDGEKAFNVFEKQED